MKIANFKCPTNVRESPPQTPAGYNRLAMDYVNTVQYLRQRAARQKVSHRIKDEGRKTKIKNEKRNKKLKFLKTKTVTKTPQSISHNVLHCFRLAIYVNRS